MRRSYAETSLKSLLIFISQWSCEWQTCGMTRVTQIDIGDGIYVKYSRINKPSSVWPKYIMSLND